MSVNYFAALKYRNNELVYSGSWLTSFLGFFGSFSPFSFPPHLSLDEDNSQVSFQVLIRQLVILNPKH